MPFVLDVSVVAGWIFEDQASEYTDAIADSLRRDEARVPAIWHLELANLLRTARRRGRIDVADAQAALAAIRDLPIRLDERRPLSADEAFALAEQFGLSSYDAACLELARRLSIGIATRDEDLRAAAGAAGVALV